MTAAFVHLSNAEGKVNDNLKPPTQGYSPNNVMGGFNEHGESLVYHPDHYDPSAAAVILLGGVATVGGGFMGAALLEFAAVTPVTVTSWASVGAVPDLMAGRWVMTGGATRWNYIKTRLWATQFDKGRGFYTTNVPFSSFITVQVSSASH